MTIIENHGLKYDFYDLKITLVFIGNKNKCKDYFASVENGNFYCCIFAIKLTVCF